MNRNIHDEISKITDRKISKIATLCMLTIDICLDYDEQEKINKHLDSVPKSERRWDYCVRHKSTNTIRASVWRMVYEAYREAVKIK